MAFLEFTPRETYFQYTSIEGFQGIIRSKQLWLNDLRKSNDPRDIVMGLDTVRDLVGDVRRNEYEGYLGFPISLIMAKLEGYYETNRLYTCCFTPERDNINMWREYAERGAGVSIGFRPRSLTDMHGRIYNVRYLQDDIRAGLRSLIVDLFSELATDEDQSRVAEFVTTIDFSTELMTMINSIKHRSWSYEREMRLTYAGGDPSPQLNIPTSLFPDGSDLEYSAPLTRMRGAEKIKYYSQPFGKYNQGAYNASRAIDEIVLGPHCELPIAYITDLMHQEGFLDFKVVKSECQFRP